MGSDYNQKRINPPPWQHDYHVLRRLYKTLVHFVDTYLKEKSYKILDYGCGTFPYKNLFLSHVSKYIGVDIGKNNDADILVKENETIPLADKSIDVIISTQVLEHVEKTDFYLSECKRLLKKGGVLILSTHGLWPYHPYPSDFYRWTRKGLESHIKKQGFDCLETVSVLGPFASITQFTLILISEKLQNRGLLCKLVLWIFSLTGNGIIWFEDKLFPPNNISDASLFVICAKKN